MGGHRLLRTAPAYAQVAELGRALAAAGVLVVSGGGPGAMEATHLGAMLANEPAGSLADALSHLAAVPDFPELAHPVVAPGGVVDEAGLAALHRWQRPAFELLATLPPERRGQSLAVPTWGYGHEPPTPFASHLAKYFSNSLREDGLLAIASDGVIYAQGFAGTIQEVFQDAAQNVYKVVRDRFSPMAFLDTDGCWTEQLVVEPLLRSIFGDESYDRHVRISTDPRDLLAFLAAG
jgi:predicted Rossmann-fold nucleotide-binding protein